MANSNNSQNKADSDPPFEIANTPSLPIDIKYVQEVIRSTFLKTATIERPETDEELCSRLRREEADAKLKRIKDLLMFLIGILLIIAFFSICSYLLFQPTTTQETKTWAMTALMSIITSVVSYAIGKNAAGE